MDSPPDLTAPRARRAARPLTAVGAVVVVGVLLQGCAAGGSGGEVGRAGRSSPGGLPVVVHVVVEASCPRADSDVVELTPLRVGEDRAQLVSGCTQDGLDSVFTFEARVPGSSTVVLAPGDVRGVVVDAARASAAGEVTVRYAPDEGVFRPVTTSYGGGEDEPARSCRSSSARASC